MDYYEVYYRFGMDARPYESAQDMLADAKEYDVLLVQTPSSNGYDLYVASYGTLGADIYARDRFGVPDDPYDEPKPLYEVTADDWGDELTLDEFQNALVSAFGAQMGL